MRIRNPYFADPVKIEADALEASIKAYLQGKPGREWVGMAKLRAAVPAMTTASRAAVNVVMQRLGAELDEEGDENA